MIDMDTAPDDKTAGEMVELLERVRRVESMLVFFFEKQAVQLNRKPNPGEKVEGESSRVLYTRTWLEEWQEGYLALLAGKKE